MYLILGAPINPAEIATTRATALADMNEVMEAHEVAAVDALDADDGVSDTLIFFPVHQRAVIHVGRARFMVNGQNATDALRHFNAGGAMVQFGIDAGD